MTDEDDEARDADAGAVAVEPEAADDPDGEAPAGGEESTEREDIDEGDHLADVDDGCGCAEIWEHLSERRAGD